MNEEQIKLLCKLAIEFGNRSFTRNEKEILKQAIDQSRNWNELLSILLASLQLGDEHRLPKMIVDPHS